MLGTQSVTIRRIKKIQEIKFFFFSSLKLGTGEAYLIQKEYPEIDFANEIIKGSINNYAYDAQSEGSRAKYIYGLIKKAKKKDKIIAKILDELIKTKEDSWGLYQLCDLMIYLHKDGYSDALKYLNLRFDKNKLEDYDICGEEQLIEIEGIDGVLKVAEFMGEILFNDEDDSEDSWKIDQFQKRNKEVDVYGILKEKGKKSKYVRTYYESIMESKNKPYKRIKRIKFSYDLINDKIKADKFRFISKERANDLTSEEVIRLANDFLNAKSNKQRELYLRFFTSRKYPFDCKVLFDIARDEILKSRRLVEFAIESLSFFKSQEIREFGIEKIKSIKNPCDYLPLLIRNYHEGDSQLLIEVIERSNDFDFIHSLVNGIIDIYKANETKECRVPLEMMYSKMNCGLHRIDILEILDRNNVLSDKIHQEMKFDSEDDVRKLYRKMKKR